MEKVKKIHPLVNTAIIVQTIFWFIGVFTFIDDNAEIIFCMVMVAVNMLPLAIKRYFLVPVLIQIGLWSAFVLGSFFDKDLKSLLIITFPLLILNIFALAKIWETRTKKDSKNPSKKKIKG